MAEVILARFLRGYSAGVLVGHLAEVVARLVSSEFAQGFEDAVCGLSRQGLDTEARG